MTGETFNGYATFYWITSPGLAACRLPQFRFAGEPDSFLRAMPGSTTSRYVGPTSTFR
jgi:hypothetical protein